MSAPDHSRNVSISATPRRVNNFTRHAAVHAYEEDNHRLVPKIKKKKATQLPVDLADAKDVSVASQKTETRYNATERPEVQFAGTLVVSDVPDIEPDEEVTTETETTAPSDEEALSVSAEDDVDAARSVTISRAATAASGTHELSFAEKVANAKPQASVSPKQDTTTPPASHIAVTSDEQEDTHLEHHSSEAAVLINPDGVIAMQRTPVATHSVSGGVLAVGTDQSVDSHGSFSFLLPVTAIAMILVLAMLGIESNMIVVNDTTITSYQFSYTNIVENVQSAFAATVAYSQNII